MDSSNIKAIQFKPKRGIVPSGFWLLTPLGVDVALIAPEQVQEPAVRGTFERYRTGRLNHVETIFVVVENGRHLPALASHYRGSVTKVTKVTH